ncbi:MAG: pentapeptide repeat-containing protein [Gammaproteobacteria bacterium]|nr:pentapeptide repeat-containing protein [Gammaproteobacteria bacterium]
MRARYYMERMKTKAAMQAVKLPAQEFGRPFAPDVAETLVDNVSQIRIHGQEKTVSGQYVEPVQLQVVCYELWENLKTRLQTNEITMRDLRSAGDVDNALADYYKRVVTRTVQQTNVSETELRQWFNQYLITEGSTRGTVYQGKNETAGLPNAVVKSLADQFLLRTEVRSGATWYELVHDRFVNPVYRANRDYLFVEQAKKVRRFRWLAIGIGLIFFLAVWLLGGNLLRSWWVTRCLPNCHNGNLSGLDLSGDDLSAADLRDANLIGIDLSETNLSEANLSGANLKEANLRGVNLGKADLSLTYLDGVYLGGANLSRANLSAAYLSGANLSRANLSGANLSAADLSLTYMGEAYLSGAILSSVNLSAAYLSGADLSGVDLRNANLNSASLSGTDLSGANLTGVSLHGTDLSGARYDDATAWPKGFDPEEAGAVLEE